MRIISTVPSQTELLSDLGLEDQVIAITKFCVHPPHWKKEKTIIGGTKNLRIEEILKLNPDLIIANKEENKKSQIEDLQEACPVYVSDIKNIDDNIELIDTIGRLTHTHRKAEELIEKYEYCIDQINPLPSIEVSYLIWKNPLMTIGKDTFIHSMLELCGFKSVHSGHRYPETSMEELRKLKPELLLLSSEPYPFNIDDVHHYMEALPGTKVKLVDGEVFSWYGTRLIHQWSALNDFLDSLR